MLLRTNQSDQHTLPVTAGLIRDKHSSLGLSCGAKAEDYNYYFITPGVTVVVPVSAVSPLPTVCRPVRITLALAPALSSHSLSVGSRPQRSEH